MPSDLPSVAEGAGEKRRRDDGRSFIKASSERMLLSIDRARPILISVNRETPAGCETVATTNPDFAS